MGSPQSLKSLMDISKLINPESVKAFDLQKQVYMLWFSQNGTFEKNHTTGLFLRNPKPKEFLPTLLVYLDNSVVLQDFRTNKYIYLMRFEVNDIKLHDIEFVLSKNPVQHVESEEKITLPELNAEEEDNIKKLINIFDLPYKQTIEKIMKFSLQKEKLDKNSNK